ncbi:MAG: hypothetical protein ACTSWL_08115 [Promethearchaeota archaeon]
MVIELSWFNISSDIRSAGVSNLDLLMILPLLLKSMFVNQKIELYI